MTIGVILHGATGRIGLGQHLPRAIAAIRGQGGVLLPDGGRVQIEPILVGRDAGKLEAAAKANGIAAVTTDLDSALEDPKYTIFFDCGASARRAAVLRRAIAAGKHIYCEKPVAPTLDEALELVRLAEAKGLKTGAVHNHLYLPGFQKLRRLKEEGFFGRLLSVRGEFGYFVFDGLSRPAQRPSWNYRREEGGGIISDVFCHWRYILDNLFAPVEAVSCLGATHISPRADEAGKQFEATAEDAAYAMFALQGGAMAIINSSWAARVHRDDTTVLQVDGTDGSAVAGVFSCKIQRAARTPMLRFSPDAPQSVDLYADWEDVPDTRPYESGFKAQWEAFLRHVAADTPYSYTLREGAKGVQLAELALHSWRERRWVDVGALPK